MDSTNKVFYKVIIIGESGVVCVLCVRTLRCKGKSAILERYVYGKFAGEYRTTIGADFLTKQIKVDDVDQPVTLQIVCGFLSR